jgi:hypothetical protein
MPPAFNPRVIPTDKLRELSHQLMEEITRLQDDYARRFQFWCHLGVINAPQPEQDIAQGACRNTRSNSTRAVNKRNQVIQELATRDIEEIRTMEAELRQKKAPKN